MLSSTSFSKTDYKRNGLHGCLLTIKLLTKGGNIKKPAFGLVTLWVKDAWDDIPQEMVKKSFLKTGISNNLNGSKNDILWEDEDHQKENEEKDEHIPPS